MRGGEYACAVIVQDGKVLLGLRAPHRKAYAGYWDVIGGKIDAGESIETALTRELGEEIGIEPIAPQLLAQLDDAAISADTSPRYHLYKVGKWHGDAPAMMNQEHTELRWFTLQQIRELSNLALPEYLPVFERALEKAG